MMGLSIMIYKNENHIYFLRHCKTINNIQNIITGQMDIPILNNQKVEVDRIDFNENIQILCSPLVRCKETVAIFAKEKSIYFNIQVINELSERNMGDLEGVSRDNALLKFPEYFCDGKFIFYLTPPGGESYKHICERAQFISDKILFHDIYIGDVVICSHNHFLKILYCYLRKNSIEENWYKLNFQNGKLYKVL